MIFVEGLDSQRRQPVRAHVHDVGKGMAGYLVSAGHIGEYLVPREIQNSIPSQFFQLKMHFVQFLADRNKESLVVGLPVCVGVKHKG